MGGIVGGVFGAVSPFAAFGQAAGGLIGYHLGMAFGGSHEAAIKWMQWGELIGGTVGGGAGAVQNALSGGASVGKGLLLGLKEAAFDAGFATVGFGLGVAAGMDPLNAANMAMMLGNIGRATLNGIRGSGGGKPVAGDGDVNVNTGRSRARGTNADGTPAPRFRVDQDTSSVALVRRNPPDGLNLRSTTENAVTGRRLPNEAPRGLEGARRADRTQTLICSEVNQTGKVGIGCFAAEMQVLTPYGFANIENLYFNDEVLTRDENDPDGPIVIRRVEQRFVNIGRIFHLHVAGQLIQTTAEHPFYVLGEGWRAAGELRIGDLLTASDGEWYPVEDVLQTWTEEKVYNVTVGECHTYFVRSPDGSVAVWSHNSEICRLYDRLPVDGENGRWISGQAGDGVYRSTDNRVRRAVGEGGDTPSHVDITFSGGAPDFNPHVRSVHGVRGETKIELDVDPKVGQRTRADRDFAKADQWLANRLNENGVLSPSGGSWNKSDIRNLRGKNSLTWHHHEDMATMQLVQRDLNDFVRHIGGRTLMDESFIPPLPFRKP